MENVVPRHFGRKLQEREQTHGAFRSRDQLFSSGKMRRKPPVEEIRQPYSTTEALARDEGGSWEVEEVRLLLVDYFCMSERTIFGEIDGLQMSIAIPVAMKLRRPRPWNSLKRKRDEY